VILNALCRIQMIERFYDPLSGQIYVSAPQVADRHNVPIPFQQLDDENITDLNVQDYRKHLALVSQEPVSAIHAQRNPGSQA
jgi:ATP-binding cassette, subfamily B (MDR/TAP), member 1